MKTLVVDASVAVKWFLPEEGADRAITLLTGKHRLIAPDLVWIELASVLWKVARKGALSAEEATAIIADASAFPVELAESLPLLPEAFRIATETDRTVYDCLYLALAAREKCTLITADQRLANALASTQWSARIAGLSDL